MEGMRFFKEFREQKKGIRRVYCWIEHDLPRTIAPGHGITDVKPFHTFSASRDDGPIDSVPPIAIGPEETRQNLWTGNNRCYPVIISELLRAILT